MCGYAHLSKPVSGHCDQIESKSRSEDDGKDEGKSFYHLLVLAVLNFLLILAVILPMDHKGLECEEKLILDNVRLPMLRSTQRPESDLDFVIIEAACYNGGLTSTRYMAYRKSPGSISTCLFARSLSRQQAIFDSCHSGTLLGT